MLRHLICLLAAVGLASAQDTFELSYTPGTGTGGGKHIVLVAGDEEYRSEESCPMLAKILRANGFRTTVLFSTDPKTGFINPNEQKNIKGTETLDSADLMIIGTRFRQLPPEQLAPIERFLNAGKPVIGFRTATHAFSGSAVSGEMKWAEFGLRILGEKWVAHHGAHKKEGTRSVVEAANAKHAVLNGVGEIFALTDVYTVKNLDLAKATVLLRGAVTETLDPASKVIDHAKNKPMQSLAWLFEYTSPNGSAKGKSFCTTLGASVDFMDEDLRRLIVNAAFHLLDLEVPAKAKVDFIDPFTATMYSGIKGSDHYKARNLKPGDYSGKSPATGLPGDAKPKEAVPSHADMPEPTPATKQASQAVAAPKKGEHIVLLGNGLAERDVYYGKFETELNLRYPESELFVRNLGHVGDTPGFRPHPSRKSQWAFPGAEKFHPDKQIHNGKGFFPTPDQWLSFLKADTIIAFFGYNESFDGTKGVANFEAELDAWVQHSLKQAYNGKTSPRIVLVSPIYFAAKAKADLPDGHLINANLQLYSEAMRKVATKHSLAFVDAFSLKDGITSDSGFIPTAQGYEKLADVVATAAFGHQSRVSKADPAKLNAAVRDRDWFWQNDYHLVNGVHTHGQRYNPFGPQNYPDEVAKTREMAALRDALIHRVAKGETSDLTVDDSKTRTLPPVPTNYVPSAKNGSKEYLYGADAVAKLKVPEGYKVEMFASEKEFPNLAKPMQMSFDNKGRLWVATMPKYPHYRPGDSLPNDMLLIYEDTNSDGKADKETVFADKLHLPIGFEFAPEGVYVSQEPNLVLLRDDNRDDKADGPGEIILGGFDTHDTHHAISAFTADPSGAVIMCEGVFLHTQVETAYGPVRCVDGGFLRFSPQRQHLERTIQMSIPNPWGYTFDAWGQDFLLHTSGPSMNYALPVQVKPTYGAKTPSTPDLVPKGHSVRPTTGLEVVSSRHFPDEVQGDLIYCNAIGFLGIKQVKIEDKGNNSAGWQTAHRHNLLESTDGNFRPADLEFAPDGSLYVLDWHNVLIGHMQHNARDPLRDHVHGRIYRITYPSRPLVKAAPVAGASISDLVSQLNTPELRQRYRVRRELRGRPAAEVLAAITKDSSETSVQTDLEKLWVSWGLNAVDEPLLRKVLASNDFHARAAAVRVLRYNTHRIADHVALLTKAADDENGRVRLEATIAASWLPDTKAGAAIVATAAKHPQDEWTSNATKTAADRLAGKAESNAPEHPVVPAPAHLSDAAKKQFLAGQEVYNREGHCVTCHQPHGNGLEPAFPPITDSPWVSGDKTRLIKVALNGLMGPLELKGKKYDGQVPMTPFGGMLKDDEIANVLTFVRNHFGNKADAVSAAEVKAVRDASAGRVMFYQVDELLKAHPMN